MSVKIQAVLCMYIVPLLMSFLFLFFKEAEISGEQAGGLTLWLVGFIFGIAMEGIFMILSFTFAALFTKKLD